MSAPPAKLPRVLVVDDNPSIHQDFRKILEPDETSSGSLDSLEDELFGSDTPACVRRPFRLDSAHQGQEALDKVKQALEDGDPYALAFVDVRMPPGWDGIVTLDHLWKADPDLQAVICTAYSDYSWQEMRQRFGERDNLLVLRKPFESMEVLQIAHAMTRKWELLRSTRHHLNSLDRNVRERTQDLHEARASLQQVHDERGQVELALQQSEERFVRAFHASPIPMVIKDARRRRFLDANPAFLQLTGFATEEIYCEEVFSEPTFHDHPVLTSVDSVGDGALRNHPLALTRRDHTTRQTLVSREHMVVNNVPCQLFILQDVTEQQILEGRLRQAQKMEAIGLLSSGVAHEFNNILTVIQCNAKLLRSAVESTSTESARVDQILDAGSRAASLTSQLLAFSRKRMLQRRRLDLYSLLGEAHGMLTSLLGERYKLHLACPRSLPPVLADEDSLMQVVMNLVLNARDAMPDGGQLQLEARHILLDEEQAGVHPEARPGSFLILQVRDHGCGMDTNVLNHLFEPFFTTKEPGAGTGLGLCTIHGIVKQHEGWIQVSSCPSQGSTFRVYLPACQTSDCLELPADPVEPGEIPRGNGEHVLVVEDEPTLREIVSEVLREYGYLVSEAQDGNEALLAFRTASTPVDLVVTDLVMPGGMTGVELAEQLTRTTPELKVLITSGYSSEIIGSDSPLDRGVPFLSKPYQPSRLLMFVHQTLCDPSPPRQEMFQPRQACNQAVEADLTA